MKFLKSKNQICIFPFMVLNLPCLALFRDTWSDKDTYSSQMHCFYKSYRRHRRYRSRDMICKLREMTADEMNKRRTAGSCHFLALFIRFCPFLRLGIRNEICAMATSTISLKPIFFVPFRIDSIVISLPNYPSAAGAASAYTGLSPFR